MTRLLSFSGCTALLFASLSACKNQAPPAAEATAAAPAPNAPAAASAPAVAGDPAPAAADSAGAPAAAAESKYSEAGFDLVLQPKGDYASGKAGEADVVLSAKPPYHVNDKYPYKFKLKEAPGLTFVSMIVTKDAVKFEPARATVPVAFTPSVGKHTLSGQLSFSVCTDDKCMIEKRDLALEIEAK
jgi:pyruvate/2-oxoglutarate dehydrogenase complex dihydrolipoamide acyltransferase (E2) component